LQQHKKKKVEKGCWRVFPAYITPRNTARQNFSIEEVYSIWCDLCVGDIAGLLKYIFSGNKAFLSDMRLLKKSVVWGIFNYFEAF
jgi:hypothetical protein